MRARARAPGPHAKPCCVVWRASGGAGREIERYGERRRIERNTFARHARRTPVAAPRTGQRGRARRHGPRRAPRGRTNDETTMGSG
eukprot:2120681-Prymnesium_polylepis.2